jgi:hypothetical protein
MFEVAVAVAADLTILDDPSALPDLVDLLGLFIK